MEHRGSARWPLKTLSGSAGMPCSPYCDGPAFPFIVGERVRIRGGHYSGRAGVIVEVVDVNVLVIRPDGLSNTIIVTGDLVDR